MRQPVETAHPQALQLEVLRVLQRHVEKRALGWNQLVIHVGAEPGNDQLPRRRVLRVGGGRSAMYVARELVEHDDERDSAAGGGGPCLVKLAAGRALVELPEAFPDSGVVLASFAE